jgi:hypothetical protein
MLLKTKLDDNVESPMKTHTEPSRKEKSQGKFSSPRNQKLVKVSPRQPFSMTHSRAPRRPPFSHSLQAHYCLGKGGKKKKKKNHLILPKGGLRTPTIFRKRKETTASNFLKANPLIRGPQFQQGCMSYLEERGRKKKKKKEGKKLKKNPIWQAPSSDILFIIKHF